MTQDHPITLIGMLDSPYVRRVAITLAYHQRPYRRLDWSVFGNASEVRQHNPLGRVPVLRLGDEDLIDSAAIIDCLDEQAGPDRATIPLSGAERRQELRRLAVALGACDKAVGLVYERHKRAAEYRDPDWDERLCVQLEAAFPWLEQEVRPPEEGLSQSQITTGVLLRFLAGYFPDIREQIASPTLDALSDALEATEPFRSAPFPER